MATKLNFALEIIAMNANIEKQRKYTNKSNKCRRFGDTIYLTERYFHMPGAYSEEFFPLYAGYHQECVPSEKRLTACRVIVTRNIFCRYPHLRIKCRKCKESMLPTGYI